MLRCIFWFLLLLSLKAHPAGEYTSYGGRAAGMGFSSVAIADAWSVFNNQAGLGWVNKITAELYFENRFLVNELSTKGIGIELPVRSGAFGLSFGEFGYSLYNEMKAGLAFGKKFGKSFAAGVQLDYLRIHIGEDLGTKHLFTFEVGLQYHINHNLCLGVHFYNPLSVKLASYDNERIPSVINLGFSWKFSDGFMTTFEAEKDIQLRPIFKAGLEYHFVKPVYIRVGVVTNPTMFTFGFGLELGQVQFDFSSSYHLVLGYSPQASLVYTFFNRRDAETLKK
jgi:hypothetical protein